ncbi:glycosyltransferase family 39 protein [Agromyces aurantiacus]|uniref:Glycosyltransferase family 39 protein n=1 Tax=Agromyces aurantiacus TaxID=165814 RepID=A0ABV9R389_9MICO|nr:glycosyltransferase family 39 protein [Agromyces aurantiacus]MBM7502959.1 mannosyltransferase [Agromyces aurantiacus]
MTSVRERGRGLAGAGLPPVSGASRRLGGTLPPVGLATRATVVGVAAAVIGYAGAGIPSYWGDEAASVLSAQRSWPSLGLVLGRIDAVHGLYYSLLHVWIRVFGAGEWSTRAPSAIAVGLLAAGTVVLAARWIDLRLAVPAGLAAAVLPRTTAMAIEARSYALAAAVAVWLTVLVVELARRRAAPAWWAAYGVGMALASTLFLYLVLLLPVHAAAVAAERVPRGTWRRFAVGAATALLLSLPILVAAYAERRQLDFLSRRDYATPKGVVVAQWFASPWVAIVAWALIGAGAIAVGAAARRVGVGADDASTTNALLPLLAWLVVPTAALLVLDRTVAPTYSPRYLSFCVPAVAMLAAAGLDAIVARAAGAVGAARGAGGVRARATARSRVAVTVIAAIAVAALLAPVYVHQRTEYAKDGGSDLREVAAYVSAHARGGDAVVFDRTTKPSRRPRLAMHLYPAAFVGLQDVALRTPYAERRSLWDRTWPVADLAAGVDAPTVWALELPSSPSAGAVPDDVAALEAYGYRVVDRQLIHRTVVYRLERG